MATKTYAQGQGGFKDANMMKSANGSFTSAAGGAAHTGWNGKDIHLNVGHDRTFIVRALMYFGIDFSDIVSVNNATLWLYYAAGTTHDEGDTADTKTKVRRMTKDWGAGRSNQAGTHGMHTDQDWDWNSRRNSNTSAFEVLDKLFTQGSNLELTSVDITEMVKAWNGEQEQEQPALPNYGLEISIRDDAYLSSTNYPLAFYSGNFNSGSNSPYLVIDYNADVAPNAPTALTPTSDEVVNTILPTFSLTQDDDDVGDYITAINVQVWHDDVTNPDNASFPDEYFWTSGTTQQSGQPQSASVQYAFGGQLYQALIPGNFYKWQGRTRDSTLKWGAFSALQRFKVNSAPNAPTIVISPTPVTDVPDDTPNFNITHNDPDPGDTLMDAYTIEVRGESSPGAGDWVESWFSGDVDISGDPKNNIQITSGTLQWGGSYGVRARTKDSSGFWSPWTAWNLFVVHRTLPPQFLWPAGNTTTQAVPELFGMRSTFTDTINAYSIRVYVDNLSSQPLTETRYTDDISGGHTFSKTYAGSTLTPGDFYQWQAKLESTIGGESLWSDLVRFQVADPAVPSIISPNGSGHSLTPTLTIDRVGDFDAVQYQIKEYGEEIPDPLPADFFDSGTVTSDIGAGGLGTRYNATYSGTALTWAYLYGIRTRVSNDGGTAWSDWSGLTNFQTTAAGAPTLTSVAGDSSTIPWITDATPDFIITRTGSDTIDQVQVIVYDEFGTDIIWDQTMTDVSNSTTATITYAGDALTPGTTFSWKARYQEAAGPTGSFSATAQFRLNGPPSIPTELAPESGHTFASTSSKTFEAFFNDPEKVLRQDFPTDWEIEVTEEDDTAHDIVNITSNLLNDTNAYVWAGTAFVDDQEYKWRTRYKDSKSEWGSYSGWNSFISAPPPNGTIDTPTNGSNIAVVNPTVTWTYSGGTQESFMFTIDETDSGGTFLRNVTTLPRWLSAATSDQIPAGYMQDTKYYDITLNVWRVGGQVDPSPSRINIHVVLDAPDPVTELVPTTYENKSLVELEWLQSSLKVGHTFVHYKIYKRLTGDQDWQTVGFVNTISQTRFQDYYAGSTTNYQYRLVMITTKSVGIELESPDDSGGGNLAFVYLDSNVWMLVGEDRDPDHIYPLKVVDEEHNRPIQQEVFETLGSTRKVVMRGFVLGNEGSITTLWLNENVSLPSDSQVFLNETVLGRRLLDYITFNAGPHIIKSPFGDVWDVEIQSPSYKWIITGHLEITIEYVETGQTSQVSI